MYAEHIGQKKNNNLTNIHSIRAFDNRIELVGEVRLNKPDKRSEFYGKIVLLENLDS